MDKQAAKNRIEKLEQQIEDLRYRYHVLNDPKVTDDVKDSLEKELKALYAKHPDLQTSSSSLSRIAGQPLDNFVKARHEIRMTSLNDIFSREDLVAWDKRNRKLLPPDAKLDYFCELKLDGLSVSLIYEKGIFVRGATRGDGLIGEDVSQNLRTIQSIPLKLRAPFPDVLEVRGEAIMSKKVLNELNARYEREGKPLLANTRNAAAGSLRQLDPKLTAERNLDFFAWDIAQMFFEFSDGKLDIATRHSDKHNYLRKLGFKVDRHESICADLEEVLAFIDMIEKLRPAFPFGTDGVVVSVNQLSLQKQLGIVGKAPRYMAAFKYPAEKATTIIKEIKVNVGRTGVLTPLAIFEPTLVAGSTIGKATLHNMDQIERLDVRVGDTVVIQKAGDVIPEVVEVLPKMRSGKEKKFKMPGVCPVCNHAVEKREAGSKKEGTSVAYYCTNPKCPAKNRRFMQHFVSVLEIYEIGPKILDRFQEEGLISDAADIFSLEVEDIKDLERFGEKSADNIIDSINQHRSVSLPKFIYSLGILHVGEQTAEDLAKAFGSLEKIKSASLEEITAIENIGPIVSKSVYEYFKDKDNLKFVEKLFKNGVSVPPYKLQTTNYKLANKTFVITGSLETMSRDEARQRIRELGGKTTESVSKQTSFVVVGSEPGSKYEKAKKLNIKILNENEFLDIIH
ncbi:MAG: NAD-dependent DNA ligase LigA [Candidatus Doudnabacteria bacterium]|nr:NAD-dependent DNA ligase LigA [Candidatus Doudnabacteria bacterium]